LCAWQDALAVWWKTSACDVKIQLSIGLSFAKDLLACWQRPYRSIISLKQKTCPEQFQRAYFVQPFRQACDVIADHHMLVENETRLQHHKGIDVDYGQGNWIEPSRPATEI